MHIVLSTYRSSLEDALVDRGQNVLAIVPTAILEQRTTQAGARYQVRSVKSWDDSGQLARIAGDLRAQSVASVDTTDEQCLRAAALLRSMLHVDGQSRIQALRATDKAVMKDALNRAGLPIARHQRIAAVADAAPAARDLGWPLVIKPRRGFGTLGTSVISSHAELGKLLSTGAFNGLNIPNGLQASGMHLAMDAIPGGLLVEEFIDASAEYHVEVLRWRGEEVYAIPGRYPAPLLGTDTFGAVLLPPGTEHDELIALARAAADALDLETGFAHVEVLRARDDSLLIGEIGLRPGGSQVPRLLELQHGIDVPAVAADLATGQRPSVTLASSPGTIAWAAAVTPRGRITAMTPAEDILTLPGVIAATSDLTLGQLAGGALGSVALGTHVYARGATAELAERNAVAALRAWHITVAPR
ncbi:hypothetical protein [Streptacidiphilus sp. EB103A]|uniref:ATP-binding protein n=1 Tax=Streptacidiphilus sp. EB103A TaxID=3156275 RepID=UPI003513B75F